jgi:hypothetical protein
LIFICQPPLLKINSHFFPRSSSNPESFSDPGLFSRSGVFPDRFTGYHSADNRRHAGIGHQP